MGYYLLIFDAEAAPREKQEFLDWWKDKSEWKENHDYDDFNILNTRLKSWANEFLKDFPPMNGSAVPRDDDTYFDNPKVIDYTCAPDLIYFCASWSVAEEAASRAFELAKVNGLGIYDLSDSGQIIFPIAVTKKQKSPWWKLWG